eukprot:4026657-Alexandrium_andersonii.AAC.1
MGSERNSGSALKAPRLKGCYSRARPVPNKFRRCSACRHVASLSSERRLPRSGSALLETPPVVGMGSPRVCQNRAARLLTRHPRSEVSQP